MANLYKGRGKPEETKQLLDMLDNVFFLEDEEETRRTFLTLLPKLYKKQYNPAYNNVILKEGEEIKAAVGCYPSEAVAAGKKLRILGIGNVAVARDSRSKGYMIDLMNMSIDIMKNENYDYSLLGGQRQRYGFFGYEPIGSECRFSIDKGNIRRILGEMPKSTYTAREVTEADTEIIKKIKALNESLPFYTDRSEEAYVDILKSWDNIPYAAFDGEEFKGYFVIGKRGGRHISEMRAVDIDDTLMLIVCAMETAKSEEASLNVPLFDTELCDYMNKNCGGVSIGTPEMINIFNFGRFIEAFLSVKAGVTKLCPGTLNLLIHGVKRDEQIAITVDGDNNVSVAETNEAPDIELSHSEAIHFIGGLYSKDRATMQQAFAQSWFPLPFFSYGLDNV